jgi:hypothetical protein
MIAIVIGSGVVKSRLPSANAIERAYKLVSRRWQESNVNNSKLSSE